MINFNLKESNIFQAVKFGKYFEKINALKKFLGFLLFVFFSLFLYGFLLEKFSADIQSSLLGLSVISFVLVIIFQILNWFFNFKLKRPRVKRVLEEAVFHPEECNLADFLSCAAAEAVYKSLLFAQKRKIPAVPNMLLYFILKKEGLKTKFIFARAGLDIEKIREELKNSLSQPENNPAAKTEFSQSFLMVISEAAKQAQKQNRKRNIIRTGDILVIQSKTNPIFKKELIDANLKTEDIENLTWWVEFLEKRIWENERFWDYRNLIKRGSICSDWAAGYTVTLDKFSIDWTEEVKRQGFEEIIGHQKEIEQVERILASPEINNALIVGQPGSGRKSIIRVIAEKSISGTSLPSINRKRIVELNLTSLVTETESIDEMEKILEEIFEEIISAGNVILVIDKFHNFIGQEMKPGTMDISGIIDRYLHLPSFQVIAITSFTDLHRIIELNSSILNLFEKVEVSEISEQAAIRTLENRALSLEHKYKKFITYPAIRDIVNLSSRYMPNVPFPKKAIELLDETIVYCSRSSETSAVLPRHVSKVISEKTQIPIGEIEIKEKNTLLNLEKLIHQRIINQEEAVIEVSSALRRARTDITVKKGPMGSFLFLGPTGVGKTETAKAIAEIYFKNEKDMIRLDMSEFQNIEDIPRLIGAAGEEGLLTTPVQENPFSLILLDEIEKSHPNVLNLFLQIIDEGCVTDGLGRKTDFSNSIIIATSNAGAEIIWEKIRLNNKLNIIKDELLSYFFKQKIFRPEFINRFDAFVIFKPLTKENLFEIAQLLLEKLKNNLAKKDIEFIITEPLKREIVKLGYKPAFGARPMRRVIQDKIEDVLAEAILSGELKRGDMVEVNSNNFNLIINNH